MSFANAASRTDWLERFSKHAERLDEAQESFEASQKHDDHEDLLRNRLTSVLPVLHATR